MSLREPRSILITGASSGIGEALAVAYAAPKRALALSGRDPARLEGVAARCRELGAAVLAEVVDVADADAMTDWIGRADAAAELDLVIANAGISKGARSGNRFQDHVGETFAVNVDGVFNTVHPAVEIMRARRRGQIAIMSSLAGLRGMPGAAAYSASKAAVRVYGESLRPTLRAKGISVSVICPGFVRSRMTARNRFPMPFLMDPECAARVIQRGLARDRGRIAFPWPMYALTWVYAALPQGLVDRLSRRLPAKD